jgi:hypothetical protein
MSLRLLGRSGNLSPVPDDFRSAPPAPADHPLFTGHPVGLISADHPKYPAKVPGGSQAMAAELTRMGLRHEMTNGHYEAPEKSFIVHGATRQQLFDLGHRFGQECVIYTQAGRHEMIHTNGHPDMIGKAFLGHAAPHNVVRFSSPPEDYWTQVPGHGYVRLQFPTENQHVIDAVPFAKSEDAFTWLPAQPFAKSQSGVGRPHPNSYPWHNGSHEHALRHVGQAVFVDVGLAKADGTLAGLPHPHMDTPPANDQAAGVGVSTYAKFAAPYGTVAKGRKSDLYHFPLHGKLADVQKLVKDHGFQAYYAGGKFGRPDLAARNYTTGHLMIYDPTPSSGGDFGDRDYTDAWRQSHELAHALTLPELNGIYGEGRRIGKLGVHRTLHEAQRAVHWEHLAAHKQRDLLASIGVHVPDDVFAREYNTVMHDAVHRAATGKFTEPSDEGFVPHTHQVPLETALGALRDEAKQMGLSHPHTLLRKSEANLAPIVPGSPHVSNRVPLPEVCKRLAKTVQERINAFEHDLRDLRTREVRKAELCPVCGNLDEPTTCTCLKKAEHCKNDACLPGEKQVGNLPGDKPSKVMDGGGGSGGEPEKMARKAMKKAMKKAAKKMAKEKLEKEELAKAGADKAPTAKAPGTAPTASHPTSKPGSPTIGKSESGIPGQSLAKSLADKYLSKNSPLIPGTADGARAAAGKADFTSASAATPSAPAGAVAGEMKPPAAPKIPGLTKPADAAGAAKIPSPKAPAAPSGT